MGSFRSQPDLTKHSINLNGAGNISYAATHMCGTSALTRLAHLHVRRAHQRLPFTQLQKLHLRGLRRPRRYSVIDLGPEVSTYV